jgi:putative hemolysin
MLDLCKGRYVARLARGPDDLKAAQRLRYLAFFGRRAGVRAGAPGDEQGGLDADDLDPLCQHVLVHEADSGALVCCFRLLVLGGGQDLHRSYAARHYDLSRLAGFTGAMIEVGRFCIHPDRLDADILRVAWAAMVRMVDQNRVMMLFGCTSFAGTDPGAYLDALALLNARHLGPGHLLPGIRAPEVIGLGAASAGRLPDLRRAQRAMPPLLRTYLAMGGWVSDHAVVDRHMNTLHVFTGVAVGSVPEARARLLRALAG